MIDISIVNFVFCKSWILNFSTGIKVATEYKYISSDSSTVVLKSTSTKSIHYINDYLINLLINFSVAPLSVDILDKEKQPIAGIFIHNDTHSQCIAEISTTLYYQFIESTIICIFDSRSKQNCDMQSDRCEANSCGKMVQKWLWNQRILHYGNEYILLDSLHLGKMRWWIPNPHLIQRDDKF